MVQDLPMNNVKVYRSGVVSAPASRGVESESYVEADAVRPAGRQGRTDGIFAAPTIDGVLRWVRANSQPYMRMIDPFVRELKVDADSVYVYSINAWEAVGITGYEKYWNTGVTLTEWLANADSYDPTEWELLLSPEDVQSARPVSDARLVKAAEPVSLYSDLAGLLKSARKNFRFYA